MLIVVRLPIQVSVEGDLDPTAEGLKKKSDEEREAHL
jgi:hypothetical protein